MNFRIRLKDPKTWLIILILAVLYISTYFFDFGYFDLGDMSITILHIPVILVTLFMGLPEGIIVSLFFGFSSMMAAGNTNPDSIDYLFRNPLLSVLPRLMIPILVWLVNRALSRRIDDNTYLASYIYKLFPAFCGSFFNTFFVVLALIILYPDKLNIGGGISATTTIIASLLETNVTFEIALVLLSTFVVNYIYNVVKAKKKEKNNEEDELKENKPIRKTFQKWLFLINNISFFVILYFLYSLLSYQNMAGFKRITEEKVYGVSKVLSIADATIDDDDLIFADHGYVIIIEDNKIVRCGNKDLEGEEIDEDNNDFKPDNNIGDTILSKEGYYNGIYGVCASKYVDGKIVAAFISSSEIYAGRNQILAILLIGLSFVFIIFYFVITFLVQRRVVNRIEIINDSLAEIRGGNLDEVVNVTGNTEFEELSQGINDTVTALKNTMDEIEEKNHQEKEFAREIQLSALPNPEYFQNENREYSVWGTMDTAEEVGGDFFDFYLLEDGRIGVIIADVSGKGVPAALFMMTAKTMIKDLILSGKSPAEALQHANAELGENNENGMFVTAWLGILDYQKGTLEFSNAGHNPPLLKKKGCDPVYMDYKTYSRSIMLAFMPDTKYENNIIDFDKEDILFLYTDGVTEARNAEKEFFGEERLKECLKKHSAEEVKKILTSIRSEVEVFVDGEKQFDDITMVVLKR
ncbi:Serine phosphatase RsbU, regulator of sigma subunit [Lachnospiraceae bacterium]|nr:Serine phosphatase RsbU, regulator of sigma subunit [Lachnospiraceae bacterium]